MLKHLKTAIAVALVGATCASVVPSTAQAAYPTNVAKGICNGYNLKWSLDSHLSSKFPGGDNIWVRYQVYLAGMGASAWTQPDGPHYIRQGTSDGNQWSVIWGQSERFNLVRGQWLAVKMQIFSSKAGGWLPADWLKQYSDDSFTQISADGLWCRPVPLR